MSKITQQKKEAKLKGKPFKTAEAENSKTAKSSSTTPADPKPSIRNFGCCCTCQFYGKPCRKTDRYVARKRKESCYKQRKG